MHDSDPQFDRLRQSKQAATLAKLRAAASDPGAANRLAAAVQAEPDPVAVHLSALRKNFPTMPFLHRPWGRAGLPDLRALADLATLRRFFSKKRPAPARRVSEVEQAEAFAAFKARFGPPRSPWSRLAFWRR